jgi:catechol 2,3-dioxygenase-like lactoylglutathione lyase family enzyme
VNGRTLNHPSRWVVAHRDLGAHAAASPEQTIIQHIHISLQQGIATMNLGRYLLALSTLAILFSLDPRGACIAQPAPINGEQHATPAGTNKAPNDTLGGTMPLNLGAFSVSLAVKDIHASRAFYEKLGFTVRSGNIDQNWLVMKNGDHVIGLFQGMFEKNILTFTPGWDQDAQPLASFTDVRELQRQLRARGVQLTTEADENTTGPASVILVDPDGNTILFDQYR